MIFNIHSISGAADPVRYTLQFKIYYHAPARGRFGPRHQGLRNVGCAPARAVLSFSYPDILFHTVFLFRALL